jgi:hypothetical protein
VKRKIQTPAANWKRALEVQSDPSKTRGSSRPVDRNGSGGIALTALPYHDGALTTSIINIPNVFGKALTEEKISSGPAEIN